MKYVITWAQRGYSMNAETVYLMSAISMCEALSRMDCDVKLYNVETGAERLYRKGLIVWTDADI